MQSIAKNTLVKAVAARSSSVTVSQLSARSFTASAMSSADEKKPPNSGNAVSSGNAQGFAKREKASEDMYILERERERYQQEMQKLAKQKKDLDDLEAKHKK